VFQLYFLVSGADAFKGAKTSNKNGVQKVVSKVDNIGAFASKNLLDDHFVKHADEFGGKFRNADEYLKGAQNFFKRESNDILQYTIINGHSPI